MFELARSKRPLPRRQEAESQQFTSDGKTQSALVSHDEIRSWAAGTQNAIICSISHAWETREHPDPCRYQLQQIVNHAALYGLAFDAEIWIFYDYMSLFQYERDPNSEQSSFEKAMANMHILYAHEFSLTFRIETLTPDEVWEAMNQNEQDLVLVWDDQSKSLKAKPLNQLMHNRVFYLERGWCKAEVEWSSLRTVNAQHQRIDQRDSRSDGDAFNGRVPMTPQAFRETMNRAEFTHRSDKDAVIHLQEKIFFEKVTSCETLVLEGLPATQIEALARALPLYENLKHLTINKFRCGEGEAQLFAEALAKTTVLEKIEVRNGEGESGKQLIKAALAEALKVNSTIVEIDLRFNGIGDEGAKARHVLGFEAECHMMPCALAEALKALAEALNVITNIDLRFNNKSDETAKALEEALSAWRALNSEEAGDQKISCRGPFGVPIRLKALAEALKVNSSITNINLSGIGIGAEGAKAWDAACVLGFEAECHMMPCALAEALKFNSSITNIDLSRIGIGAEGAKAWPALAEALKVNTSVANIELQGNGIGDAGAKALAEAMRTNSSLNTIKLQYNGIGPEGAKAWPFLSKLVVCHLFAKRLPSRIALSVHGRIGLTDVRTSRLLNVDCRFRQALAEALKVNSSITNINLECNHIGAEGAKARALAEALKVNTSITDINLERNGIGDAGAKALAEAMRTNLSLNTIDLSWNDIGPEGAKAWPFLSNPIWLAGGYGAPFVCQAALAEALKALAEALKVNTSITDIHLWDNHIGAEGAKARLHGCMTHQAMH
eukprot:s287_g38.t2